MRFTISPTVVKVLEELDSARVCLVKIVKVINKSYTAEYIHHEACFHCQNISEILPFDKSLH